MIQTHLGILVHWFTEEYCNVDYARDRNSRQLRIVTAKMSNENGDDTVMDDAQESQNGELAADELELDETKLFLV